MTTIQKEQTLKVSDRCDRCNAQARVLVKGLQGELYFCSHHFNKHEEKLSSWSYEIVDEREFIV
jgi:hypothetical protein